MFVAILILSGIEGTSQNKRYADSLKLELEKRPLSDSLRADILFELIAKVSSPVEKDAYADSLLMLKNAPIEYQIRSFLMKGLAAKLTGDLKRSLSYYFNASEIALENNLNELLAEAYLEIGSAYTSNQDHQNALEYNNKAINIFRNQGLQTQLAINLLNTGYIYYTLEKYDSALQYYQEAGTLFDSLNLQIGRAYNLGNRALVYWKTGNVTTAKNDLLKAIDMLQPLGDKYAMADYHNQLGNLHLQQGENNLAIKHLKTGLNMAMELGLKEQIQEASLILSQLYTQKQQFEQALRYHQQYVQYKDSITNDRNTREMANIRTAFEVNLREKEIDSLEKDKILQQTYIIIAVILLLLSIAVLLYFRQRLITAKLLAADERKQHDLKIKDLLRGQETKALQSMVQGKEQERKHLAKELHNHLGSLLATIKVNLNGLDSDHTPRHKTIVSLVDQACQDVRNISHELNMGVSEGFGLIPALKELTSHLQQSNDLEVEFAAVMGEQQLDSENEIILYRIVQELVSNVLKHADATKLSIYLTYFEEESLVNILVEDNGKGFEIDQINGKSDGMGIETLQEMVKSFQGDIRFDSSPNRGTTVNIDLPIVPQSSLEI